MLVTYIMLHYIVYVTVHIFTIPYITLKFRRIRNFLFAKSFISLKREGLIFCNNSLVNDYGSKNLVTVYFTYVSQAKKRPERIIIIIIIKLVFRKLCSVVYIMLQKISSQHYSYRQRSVAGRISLWLFRIPGTMGSV